MHACDGQTDGQTNRQRDRILIARPRLHCMQRGKKIRGLLFDSHCTSPYTPSVCLSVRLLCDCMCVCLCTEIEQSFLPWLTDSAVDSLHRQVAVRQVLDDVIRHVMSSRRELMNQLEAQFLMIQTGSQDDLVRLTAFMNQGPDFQKILGKILRLA